MSKNVKGIYSKERVEIWGQSIENHKSLLRYKLQIIIGSK
jgi:hypothetical protein